MQECGKGEKLRLSREKAGCRVTLLYVKGVLNGMGLEGLLTVAASGKTGHIHTWRFFDIKL